MLTILKVKTRQMFTESQDKINVYTNISQDKINVYTTVSQDNTNVYITESQNKTNKRIKRDMYNTNYFYNFLPGTTENYLVQ